VGHFPPDLFHGRYHQRCGAPVAELGEGHVMWQP
jgi:hypothetical protein